MSRKCEKSTQKKKYIIIMIVIILLLLVGVLSKYIFDHQTDVSQVTADKFYFTVDVLGDTTMESDGNGNDSFGEKSTTKTWQLYGASEHQMKIKVQNYFDELRINDQDIEYKADVNVEDPNGKMISFDRLELKDGDQTFKNGKLIGKEKQNQTLILQIPSYDKWNYKDGTTVIAKIQSTSPYKKTLTMRFILYATDTSLKYKIVDDAKRPYAELILMSNVEKEVQPYLVWSKELQIDNTNPYTFQHEKGEFIQQSGIEERNMQISKPLKTGESESIYFFKSDRSKNFSQEEVTVNPENGKYVIHIGD